MGTEAWNSENYEQMSWHDNYVHGIQFVEGECGSGQLLLDIDYILEWLKPDDGGFEFRIAPATLEFHEVMNLNIAVNYKSVSAAMGPFSIDGIERSTEKRERYTAILWKIPVNFPNGVIEFESKGFSQSLRSKPQLTNKQWLTEDERKST